MSRLNAALAAGAVLLAATPVLASSHREAPMISKDPNADATDLYAWRRGDTAANSTVVLVANYVPAALPFGGPNFYEFADDVLYEIHVDHSGDNVPDVTYQWRFTTRIDPSPLPYPPQVPGASILYAFAPIDPATYGGWLRRSTYTLTKVENGTPTVIGSNLAAAPWNIGTLTTPNYDSYVPAAVHTLANGRGTAFAGPRDDPFFVNLHEVFDFLDVGNDPRDDLAGVNVMSLVLEVPLSELSGGAAIADGTPFGVGIWTTASRKKVEVRRNNGSKNGHGGWVQVSRLGNPLINEAIVPMAFKDFFNASKPVNDLANYGAVVLDPELPYLLQAKGFVGAIPAPPRTDLVAALATSKTNQVGEVLHLDLATPESSSTGFPNGRRLADDVTDIALTVVGGAPIGDGVPANDLPFLTQFPYVPSPHAGNR